MLINIYNFILAIIYPFIFLYFKYRISIGKDNLQSVAEKSGYFPQQKPAGKLIWFHAVSVGETISILPLIERLNQRKNITILLTTTTLSSAKIASERVGKNIYYQYLPLDFKKNSRAFLKHYQPDLAIFTESELWPNYINEAVKLNIPLILLNARISDKNYLKNFFYQKAFGNLLAKFSLILPQELQDLTRLEQMKLKNLKLIGNLKLDAPILPYNKTELAYLKKLTNKRKLFLCVSTHAGEEKLLAQTHHNLRLAIPELLTIIIPRHPERRDEIISTLKEELNLATSIRSQKEVITERTDIYLADSFGELGLFYQLCDIAFIGGSLIKRGGHNPYEGLRFNNVIITGPHYFNFKNIYENLLQENIAYLINDEYDLKEVLFKLLTEVAHKNSSKARSKQFISKKQNILNNTVAELIKFL